MAQNVTLVPPGANDTRQMVDINAEPVGDASIAFDIPRQQAPPQRPLQPPVRRQPPPPQRQVRFQPVAPSPLLQPEELNDFANPRKIDEIEEEEEENNSPGEEQFDENYEYQHQYNNQPEYEEGEYIQTPPMPPQLQPLPPFETLEDERADLMYKLQRASKNGVSVRNFAWNTDIRELRVEASRARTEQEINTSVAFQRHLLMMICTGLEYANKTWSYLDLELDGWSSSVMDDIGKYDIIFEKLHKKHAGNFNLPPELQLIFMIGGSAMTWHLIAKSAGDRTKSERRPRKRKVVYSESESSESESDREVQRRRYSKPRSPPKQKREMRGPGFDAGSIVGGLGGFGGLGGLGGMAAGLAGINKLPQVPVPNLTPKFSRPGKIQEIESASEEEEDRLSDIPSEDLEEVPSTIASPRSDASEKVIEVSEKPKRKRNANGKKKPEPKKVVVI